MVCIHCGSDTKVVNSRPQKRANQIWRRRECLTCGTIFTTEEAINYHGTWRVRGSDGRLKPFMPLKLTLSLYRSLQHRPTALADAEGLSQTVINKLLSQTTDGQLTAIVIKQTAVVALTRFDQTASVHYRAFHKG